VAHGFAAGDVVGGGDGADVVGDADVLMLALPGTGVPGCGPFAPWVPQAATARAVAVRTIVVSRRCISLASLLDASCHIQRRSTAGQAKATQGVALAHPRSVVAAC
jgi:hypothetical protein